MAGPPLNIPKGKKLRVEITPLSSTIPLQGRLQGIAGAQATPQRTTDLIVPYLRPALPADPTGLFTGGPHSASYSPAVVDSRYATEPQSGRSRPAGPTTSLSATSLGLLNHVPSRTIDRSRHIRRPGMHRAT